MCLLARGCALFAPPPPSTRPPDPCFSAHPCTHPPCRAASPPLPTPFQVRVFVGQLLVHAVGTAAKRVSLGSAPAASDLAQSLMRLVSTLDALLARGVADTQVLPLADALAVLRAFASCGGTMCAGYLVQHTSVLRHAAALFASLPLASGPPGEEEGATQRELLRLLLLLAGGANNLAGLAAELNGEEHDAHDEHAAASSSAAAAAGAVVSAPVPPGGGWALSADCFTSLMDPIFLEQLGGRCVVLMEPEGAALAELLARGNWRASCALLGAAKPHLAAWLAAQAAPARPLHSLLTAVVRLGGLRDALAPARAQLLLLDDSVASPGEQQAGRAVGLVTLLWMTRANYTVSAEERERRLSAVLLMLADLLAAVPEMRARLRAHLVTNVTIWVQLLAQMDGALAGASSEVHAVVGMLRAGVAEVWAAMQAAAVQHQQQQAAAAAAALQQQQAMAQQAAAAHELEQPEEEEEAGEQPEEEEVGEEEEEQEQGEGDEEEEEEDEGEEQ